MRVVLVLYNVRETRPCTLSEQHSRANPAGMGSSEPTGMHESRRAGSAAWGLRH